MLYFVAFLSGERPLAFGLGTQTAVRLVTDRVEMKRIDSRSIRYHALDIRSVQTGLTSLSPRSVVHGLTGLCPGPSLP